MSLKQKIYTSSMEQEDSLSDKVNDNFFKVRFRVNIVSLGLNRRSQPFSFYAKKASLLNHHTDQQAEIYNLMIPAKQRIHE